MKNLSRLLAFSLVAVMLLGVIPFTASAASLSSMKVVCFGDSLTHYGDGWTTQEDEFGNKIAANKAYPDLLTDLIGTSVYNAGVGGDTTALALNRFYREVLPQNPDVVVICLGMNDQSLNTAANTNLLNIDSYRTNLERFVRELNAAGSDVVFLTPSPACAEAGCLEGYPYNSGQLPPYLNAMREVAIKTGCTYIDGNEEFNALSNLKDYYIQGDGVHQSRKGREYFASLVAEHLKAVYENNNKATMTVICKDNSGKELTRYTLTGAAGALITVPSPQLGGYTPTTADVKTTFTNGATHTFVYTSDVVTLGQKANSITAAQLNAEAADEFFACYDNGRTLMNASPIDFDALAECVTQMQAIIDGKATTSASGEQVISIGASYTVTASNYKQWDSKNNCERNELNHSYADDGVKLTDGRKGYSRGEDSRYAAWTGGVDVDVVIDLGTVKDADTFRAYVAGDEWGVAIASGLAVSYKVNESDAWTKVNAGSVKKMVMEDTAKADHIWSTATQTITLSAPISARYLKITVKNGGGFIWIDEVEAALKQKYSDTVNGTIDGINNAIVGNDTRIFLGGYDFSHTSGNLKYVAYVKGEIDYTKGGAIIINEVGKTNGTDYTKRLGVSEVLIAANYADESCWKDFGLVDNAKVGQEIKLHRLDTANGAGIAVTFEICDYVAHTCKAEGEWKTDKNNHWKLCDCGKIVDKAAHEGEWEIVKAPEIGVEGEKQEICKECGYVIATETIPALKEDVKPTYERLRGDVNNSGAIDMMDYILLKRNYFGTFEFDEAQLLVADVNNGGTIDMMDYILLKRVYFGTFEIADDLKFVELAK